MKSSVDFLKGVNKKKPEAWKELYKFFYGALCNYSNKIVSDKDVSEDIVQECFIAIWKGNLFFSDIKALSTYLYRSIYHNSLKYLRDQDLHDLHMRKWSEQTNEEVEELFFYEAVEEEAIRQLRTAISDLPRQHQAVLMLTIDGHSIQSIASELKISVNTVKTHKKRAYAHLRKVLKHSFMLILLSNYLSL